MSNVITLFALVPVAQFNTIKEKYITENEVPALLDTIHGAEFFSMVYYKKDGSRREASAVVQTWSHAAAASRCFSGGFQSAFIVPTYSAVVPSDISVSSLPSFLLEEFPEHNFCIC